MQPNSSLLSRRSIIVAAILVAIVAVGSASLTYLARPTLIVSAPAGSTIRVLDTAGNTTVSKQAGKPTTRLSVPTGAYELMVANGRRQQLFYGTIAAFQKRHHEFTAASELNTRLVASNTAAYNVMSDDTSISFLNTTKRIVENIDQNGSATALDSQNLVTSFSHDMPGAAQVMYPIAGNAAVVLTHNQLYRLQDSRLTPLNASGFPSSISSFAIGTNPTLSSFVVAVNRTLYLYSTADARPQKILDLPKQIDQLVYGGSKAIAYSTRMPSSSQDIKGAYRNYAIDPVIIDIPAKTQKILQSGPISAASISPDGNQATIQPQQAGRTSLYDLRSGQVSYYIENSDILSPLWIDGSHMAYSKGSVIWNLDTATRSATVLGVLPDGLEPTSITYTYRSSDASYFVTAYNSERQAAIYRLSSTTSGASALAAAALAASTPPNSEFSLGYIDILHPTLRITTMTTLNAPTEDQFKAATLQSRIDALNYLRQHSIDSSQPTIVYSPSDTEL